MRELFRHKVAKSVASCALAGGLAMGLYAFATPGRTLERAAFVQTGHAVVVDGDTIDLAGQRVRLEGIDAPEIGQTCPGRFWLWGWNAGAHAKRELARMIGTQAVTCRSLGRDKYGRVLGVCSVGQLELNAEMVRRGMAWAFVKYSQSYVVPEQVARANKVGIWRKACTPAWDYRAARWQVGASDAPRGCAIKGNISKRGERLYHMPWSAWYGRTKIEPHSGERWFCDEQAGSAMSRKRWRPAGGRRCHVADGRAAH
jgi:endonuclease YncB( thermonuclease family)